MDYIVECNLLFDKDKSINSSLMHPTFIISVQICLLNSSGHGNPVIINEDNCEVFHLM